MADKKLFPNLKKATLPVQPVAQPREEKATNASGNVFTNLFDDNGKQKTATADSVVESVMKKTDTKSILGPKPKTYDVTRTDKPVHFASGFLKFVMCLWLVMLVGSYLTMWAGFDLAGLNQSVKAEENLISLKTEQAKLNAENYLVAYYYLDNFAYNADAAESTDLQEEMIDALSIIQEKLSQPIVPEDVSPRTELTAEVEFKEATIAYLENQISKLESESSSEDVDIQLEITGLNGALALVKNGVFKKELLAIDTTNKLDIDTIESVINGLNSIVNDNFTLIGIIKNERMSWENIIKEIEKITKKVDPLYGSSVESDISYSSYSLDSKSKAITLQGATITDDTRNFTLISDLIDMMEQSTLFKDVQERSFSKNDSSAADDSSQYEAAFKLELKLQEDEDERDAKFSLETIEEDAVTVKVPTGIGSVTE